MENIYGQIVATGIGATAVMDIWAWLLRRLFASPSLDYALVGRALLWLRHGKLFHHPIMSTSPKPGEKAVGWLMHYVTGVAFAALLSMVAGEAWFSAPTPAPALLTGVLTLCFPFFIMQPLFGFGVAAANTPAPNKARRRSLIPHIIFGAGLYVTAWLINTLS